MLDSTTFDITVNIDLSHLSRQHTNVESNSWHAWIQIQCLGLFLLKQLHKTYTNAFMWVLANSETVDVVQKRAIKWHTPH